MADSFRHIDLHMHTAVSDGTDTPPEILQNVKAAGIRIFSVTDHDAMKAGEIIRPLLKAGDPAFIPGIELSCRDEKGKYHILGYGYDANHEAMRSVVAHGHSLRMKKVRARLDFLQTQFGFQFPQEEIEALLALDNPGKPHIGQLMVRYGYASSVSQAIQDYLDQLQLESEYVRPEEAIAAILAGGGVPVLAHPFYGSGDEQILGQDMEQRLNRLMAFGLQGLEAYYAGFSGKLRAEAVELAERFGLFTTVGSDYHGRNKLVRLGDAVLDGCDEIPQGLQRFLEVFGL